MRQPRQPPVGSRLSRMAMAMRCRVWRQRECRVACKAHPIYGCLVPDKETLRQNVREAFERFMTGGEAELAERLYHPDYVNHEADPERSSGIEGARATAEWLRSCFGDVSYEVERIIVEDDMVAAYVTM